MKGRKTQGERILDYLDEYGTITPIEAFRDLGITKLATRISELRKEGIKINKKYITVQNRFGQNINVMEYSKA